MTGLSADDMIAAVRLTMAQDEADRSSLVPEDYMITNTSNRVVRLILSTAHSHHNWAGIRTRGR